MTGNGPAVRKPGGDMMTLLFPFEDTRGSISVAWRSIGRSRPNYAPNRRCSRLRATISTGGPGRRAARSRIGTHGGRF